LVGIVNSVVIGRRIVQFDHSTLLLPHVLLPWSSLHGMQTPVNPTLVVTIQTPGSQTLAVATPDEEVIAEDSVVNKLHKLLPKFLRNHHLLTPKPLRMPDMPTNLPQH